VTAPGTSEAATGGRARRRGSARGEQPMVPEAAFDSYYGQPILSPPTWEPLDIAGYLFLGGLAGASSALAAGAQATGRPGLARTARSVRPAQRPSRSPPWCTIWAGPRVSCTCCGSSR
jgi:hypothetical protein